MELNSSMRKECIKMVRRVFPSPPERYCEYLYIQLNHWEEFSSTCDLNEILQFLQFSSFLLFLLFYSNECVFPSTDHLTALKPTLLAFCCAVVICNFFNQSALIAFALLMCISTPFDQFWSSMYSSLIFCFQFN